MENPVAHLHFIWMHALSLSFLKGKRKLKQYILCYLIWIINAVYCNLKPLTTKSCYYPFSIPFPTILSPIYTMYIRDAI